MSNNQTPYKIEKNAPPPETSLPAMPLAALEVGDRFKVTLKEPSDKATIRQRVHRFQKKNPPIRLSVRKIDEDHCWVYRLEDKET
jgi:hypothetical protein